MHNILSLSPSSLPVIKPAEKHENKKFQGDKGDGLSSGQSIMTFIFLVAGAGVENSSEENRGVENSKEENRGLIYREENRICL